MDHRYDASLIRCRPFALGKENTVVIGAAWSRGDGKWGFWCRRPGAEKRDVETGKTARKRKLSWQGSLTHDGRWRWLGIRSIVSTLFVGSWVSTHFIYGPKTEKEYKLTI